MRRPRLQFTVRGLILLVAGCAVVFALLRTPFGVLVVAFGLVLPGFLIERAQGGAGILGGAISACVIACAGGLAIAVLSGWSSRPGLGDALLLFVVFPVSVSLCAFLLGWILSCMLYGIFKLLRTLLESPLRDESNGSIRWHRLDDGPVERY